MIGRAWQGRWPEEQTLLPLLLQRRPVLEQRPLKRLLPVVVRLVEEVQLARGRGLRRQKIKRRLAQLRGQHAQTPLA